jgi:hypothetical protein
MTTIRLEDLGSGPTFRYGQLRLPSGNAVALAVLHTDWDALERLVKAAENELASWVEDDRRAEQRMDRP